MQQTTLTAGDTLTYLTTIAGYPASAGWVLKYRLVPRVSGTAQTLTSTASGDDHRITVAASTTASWTAGEYGWTSWVENGSEVYSVETGQLTVAPDPRTMAVGTDTRSHAERMLDAIKATLEGRATDAHLEIEINGRRLRYLPPADLLVLRDRYAWEVRAQRAAIAGTSINRLQVRL